MNDRTIRVDLHHHVFELEKPSECPMCHKCIALNEYCYVSGSIFDKSNRPVELQVIYKCVGCFRLFIANYLTLGKSYPLLDCEPKRVKDEELEEEINSLSPEFPIIYYQALEAEARGLDHIAGMGLRKAFEFLVKDYCISINPDRKEEIESLPLSNCINNYFGDLELVALLKRVAWIGNDACHYKRKWEKMDIVDLKRLLKVAIVHILHQAIADKYIREMPET